VFSNLAVALLVMDPSGCTKDEDAELVSFKYILSFSARFSSYLILSRSVWGSAAIKVIWGCEVIE
jgi:hypothetical protein